LWFIYLSFSVLGDNKKYVGINGAYTEKRRMDEVDSSMKPGEYMSNEIAEIPGIYRRGIESEEDLQVAISYIRSRTISNVQILARGSSDNAAHFLKFLIEVELGLPVGLSSPSTVSIYGSELHLSETLLIAISQSGKSPDLLAYLETAKRAGAATIAITNSKDSPMASAAELHLDVHAGPELAVAASKSFAAQMLMSYSLVTTWSGKKVDYDHLADSAQALLKIDLTKVVESFDLNRQIVVLGRGASFANAKELALKIQETCHVSVQSWSTADYLHGPISALSRRTQIILFAPSGVPDKLLEDVLPRLYESQADIFWIGSGLESQRGTRIGGSVLQNEFSAAIVDVLLLQRFAQAVSRFNGFNPDAPIGLSKVTLTN